MTWWKVYRSKGAEIKTNINRSIGQPCICVRRVRLRYIEVQNEKIQKKGKRFYLLVLDDATHGILYKNSKREYFSWRVKLPFSLSAVNLEILNVTLDHLATYKYMYISIRYHNIYIKWPTSLIRWFNVILLADHSILSPLWIFKNNTPICLTLKIQTSNYSSSFLA